MLFFSEKVSFFDSHEIPNVSFSDVGVNESLKTVIFVMFFLSMHILHVDLICNVCSQSFCYFIDGCHYAVVIC